MWGQDQTWQVLPLHELEYCRWQSTLKDQSWELHLQSQLELSGQRKNNDFHFSKIISTIHSTLNVQPFRARWKASYIEKVIIKKLSKWVVFSVFYFTLDTFHMCWEAFLASPNQLDQSWHKSFILAKMDIYFWKNDGKSWKNADQDNKFHYFFHPMPVMMTSNVKLYLLTSLLTEDRDC